MRWLLLILCVVASPCFGQTYETLIADADLLQHWDFQETTATTTLVAETGSNATLTGGDTADAITTTGPTAWLPNALTMSSTGYASFANTSTATSFTFFTWLKLPSRDGLEPVAGTTITSNAWVAITGTGVDPYEISLRAAAAGTRVDTSVGTFDTNWHSIAAVRRTGDSWDLYLDGSLEATGVTGPGDQSITWNQIARRSTEAANGMALAGTMIFDRDLSTAEIAALHAGPSSGPAINPISDSIPGSAVNPIRTTIP